MTTADLASHRQRPSHLANGRGGGGCFAPRAGARGTADLVPAVDETREPDPIVR
jgi:hypothetical protein